MNNKLLIMITLVVGIVVGIVGSTFFLANGDNMENMQESAEDEPLYWVAPMDANFRREQPGLSPMGMELVPVYQSSGGDEAGVISISPTVVNNLGVRIATATLGKLEQEIRTSGAVEFDEESRVDIHPRVDGWIETLHVKAMGDKVRKGQPLYDLYSPELVNAQEELVIAVKQNNKRLIGAAVRRLEALLVSKEAINTLKSTLKIRNSLTIDAPMSGVVDSMMVREGGYVKPMTKLLSISALDDVWVTIDVVESQSSQVNIGDKAMMTVAAFPSREWQGVIDEVYPMLESSTRTLQVRLRVNNKDHALKPNMYANVVLQNTSPRHTVLIPNEAVIKTGRNNRVVMALGDGKFKSVAVELGRSNGQLTQILSGLQANDDVVVSAQFLLDSESNIASDLMRIEGDKTIDAMEPASALKVWTKATVNRVMSAHEMLNVSHEAIPAWNWLAMDMNFYVDESINIDDFSAGQVLEIEIMVDNEGDYIITDVKEAGQADD